MTSDNTKSEQETVVKKQLTIENKMVTVDLCPECGEASMVFEESCKKCYGCGYSEC